MATLGSRLTRRPEWPLVLVFTWFPLWWVLGLTQLAFLAATVWMAWWLLRRTSVTLPHGLGWWLLFLVTVGVGVVAVKVDVPGAMHLADDTRYLTWALRMVWLVEATVVLLYIRNTKEQISSLRVSRILATMFVTIVVGGLLGSLAPTIQLHSLAELVLPGRLASSPFVASLVHPNLAERQVYLDQVNFRPSAPFPYANDWGLNFACFLPFFLRAWLGRDAGRRRYLAPVVLTVAAVPVVYSGNRGLWAVLLLLMVVLIVKQATAGRYRPLLALAAAVVIGATVVALSPLSTALEARFSGHNSNQGRLSLAAITIKGMAESSPVIGDGTTRKAQGSFYSIAGGATPDCYTCAPPALGTQGFLWWMLFATGFVGAALGLVFLLTNLWRHRHGHDPTTVACWCVVIAFVAALPVYDWTITAGFAAMTALALLDRRVADPRRVVAVPLRLGSVCLHPSLVVGCVVTGILLGGVWQWHHGPTYVARVTVYLPSDASQEGRATTLDTQARFIDAPAVLAPTADQRAGDRAAHRGDLTVEATANSRLLIVSYTSTDPVAARTVAETTANGLIRLSADTTGAAQHRERSTLLRRLDGDLMAEDRLLTGLKHVPTGSLSDAPVTRMTEELAELRGDAASTSQQLRVLSASARDVPQIVGQTAVTATPQRWNVALASGLVLGLLVGVGAERVARRRGPRLGSLDAGRRRMLGLDLPVTEQMPEAVSYLSADPRNSHLCSLSAHITSRQARAHPRRPDVMLVATRSTRVSHVMRTRARLESHGVPVAGVLLTSDRREEHP